MKIIVAVAVVWVSLVIYGQNKPLPKGVSLEGAVRAAAHVEFLTDCTYQRNGQPVREQAIFNRVHRIIDGAERFILLDFFLFNGVQPKGGSFPALAEEMTRTLVEKKQRAPQVDIVLITDTINRSYGAEEPEHFQRLRANGVRVVYTDTSRLRDSNFMYSAWWRLFCQWFGAGGNGWLPSPFAQDGPAMTLRGYLSLFNFKANHRKVVASEKEALITSANPHDASAYHSNIAIVAQGPVVQDVVESEAAVARFSGETLPQWEIPVRPQSGEMHLRVLTEGKIKSRLLQGLTPFGGGLSGRVGLVFLFLPQVFS